MDYQRQPGFTGGRDVGAEAVFLRLARRVVVVVVETGLAKRNDFGLARARDEVGRADVEFLMGVVRMRADRAEHVRKRSVMASKSAWRATRVEIVTMRATPAARARATTPSSSVAKSGKSRWQWLSISIVIAPRAPQLQCNAGTPAPAPEASRPGQYGGLRRGTRNSARHSAPPICRAVCRPTPA